MVPPALTPSEAIANRALSFAVRRLTVVLLAALPVYFIALGANSIWDANEAFYVETPRQMVETGDYITPSWNGELRVNKPVLSYWIVAGLYQVAGVSVTVERVGIALGAMGIILATFLVGRALRSTSVGIVAALIVASAPRMVMFSRRIFIDIYITLFLALALACFALATRRPEHRRRYLVAMYVAMGLGMLTKGPVAVVLPAVVVAVWLSLEHRWADARRLMLVPGALIVIGIVAPWYVALYATHGMEPVRSFFIGENLDRYATSMVPGARHLLFYVPVLLGDLFPWAPLFLVPLFTAWRRRAPGEDATDVSIRRMLWVWVVAFTAVFSLSQTKQDLYIFPVVPAVAALVADALVRTRFGAAHAGLGRLIAVVSALTVLGGVAVSWLFGAGYYEVASVRPAALVLIIGGSLSIAAVLKGVPDRAVVALAVTFVVFNYVFVARVLPELERFKPAVPLARTITARVAPTAGLADYKGALPPSLVYYVGRPVERIGVLTHAQAFFASGRPSWALVHEADYPELLTAVPTLCEVARQSFFEVKLRDLLDDQPPPSILLVTNQCGTGVPRLEADVR
jgi:4-amino-4-deoxy-L-arabinose transferase-like glycosyltransferase